MDRITFNAWVAREAIDDKYYPRTYLFDEKPRRKPIVYWGRSHKGCEWCETHGKMGSYKLKELVPFLTYDDEPVEVEVTIKIIKRPMEEKIQNEITLAMKAKDEIRLSALRSVKAAILNEKSNGKHHELTDADVVTLIQKLVKQRQESENIYSDAGRLELAEKERRERIVLEEFVPKQLTEEEIEKKVKEIIIETGATSMKDMGKVMGLATQRMKGVADGKIVSGIVRKSLV